jgi:excisionase family DNA binding protein
MTEPLYTTNQLAKLFGVVPTTVIDWIEKGKLEAFKTLGGHRRITHRAVLDFLERNHLPYPPAFAHDAPKLVVLDGNAEALRAIGTLLAQGLPDSRAFLENHAVDALIRMGVERPRRGGRWPASGAGYPRALPATEGERRAFAAAHSRAGVSEVADPLLADRLHAAGADDVLTRGAVLGRVGRSLPGAVRPESAAAGP